MYPYLPNSAKVVLEVMNTPMTIKILSEKTGMPPRTLRYAIKRLKEHGCIVEKFNFRDARSIIYQKAPVHVT